jgi:hypothetical protein
MTAGAVLIIIDTGRLAQHPSARGIPGRSLVVVFNLALSKPAPKRQYRTVAILRTGPFELLNY